MTLEFVERTVYRDGIPVKIQVRPETAAKLDEIDKAREQTDLHSHDVLAAARAVLAAHASGEPAPAEEDEDDILGDEKTDEKPKTGSRKGSRNGTPKADQ